MLINIKLARPIWIVFFHQKKLIFRKLQKRGRKIFNHFNRRCEKWNNGSKWTPYVLNHMRLSVKATTSFEYVKESCVIFKIMAFIFSLTYLLKCHKKDTVKITELANCTGLICDISYFYVIKGALHLITQISSKLACFVLYLKIINIYFEK